MATTIQLKRSSTNTSTPSGLAAGEPAINLGSGTQGNAGDRLYVGTGSGNHIVGGKYYTDMMDQVHGVLTQSSAIIVDSNSSIDTLNVGRHASNGGTLKLLEGTNTGTSGVILKSPNSLGGDVSLTLPDSTGSNGQFLKTDGSGNLSFATVVSNFTVSDNAGTPNTTTFDTGDTLKISGGTNITSTLSDSGTTTTVTLDVATATTGALGVASFASGDFDVSSGAVSIKADGVSYSQIQNVATANRVLGSTSADGIISEVQITNAMVDNSAAIAVSKTALVAGAGLSLSTNTLSVDADQSGQITAVGNLTVGSGSADASVQSDGDYNLVLKTGNSTTGTVTITDGANGNIILAPNGSGVVNVDSSRITGVSDPVNDDDAANKAYVDATKSGLDIKDSVRVATTAALPNSPTYNQSAKTLTAGSNVSINTAGIDGVTNLALNDRILVKNQAETRQNGIYIVTAVGSASGSAAPWVFTRASDADTGAEFTGGSFTFVEEGSTQNENGYVFTHNGTPTLTDSTLSNNTQLTVSQFSGAGQVIAGTGLTKSGNTINAVGSNTIIANANSLEVNSSGTQYQILVSGGTAGTAATFGQLSLNQSAAVTGTLPVANGGSGAASFTDHGILVGSGTGAFTALAAGTAGQFLISGGSSADPSYTSTIDGGSF